MSYRKFCTVSTAWHKHWERGRSSRIKFKKRKQERERQKKRRLWKSSRVLCFETLLLFLPLPLCSFGLVLKHCCLRALFPPGKEECLIQTRVSHVPVKHKWSKTLFFLTLIFSSTFHLICSFSLDHWDVFHLCIKPHFIVSLGFGKRKKNPKERRSASLLTMCETLSWTLSKYITDARHMKE